MTWIQAIVQYKYTLIINKNKVNKTQLVKITDLEDS